MKPEVQKTELEKKLEAAMKTASTSAAPDSVPEPNATSPRDPGECTLEDANDAAADLEVSPDEQEEGISLAEELVKRTAERDEFKDQLLRARAEFDNFKKRSIRETERVRKTAAEGLILELLPIMDNLERALDHAQDESGGLAEGVQLVLTQLRDVLRAQGLEAIPAVGQPFDPHVHEALLQAPSEEYPAGTIIAEYSRGYRLAGFVLRHAKVVVSSGAPGEAGDSGVSAEFDVEPVSGSAESAPDISE